MTNFIKQLYTTFLGRNSDPSGLAFWTEQLDNGTVNAAQMTLDFIQSNEFTDSVAPIARLYFAAFNRIPDAGGLAFWVSAFQNGATLDEISEGFTSSSEFQTQYGDDLDNSGFLDLLYQNVFNREADPQGKTFWLNAMDNGSSRAEVLAGFAGSQEHINDKSDEIKIILIYHGITEVAPTQSELDDALADNDLLALITRLYASDDYTGVAVPGLDIIAPEFTSSDTADNIDENSGDNQLIYTAIATDDSPISYSLKASEDSTDFSIDSNTGNVTLTTDPDFETKANYSFTVIATDTTGNASEHTISLEINDLNDTSTTPTPDTTAPVFTSAATASAVNENSGATQVIYTAVATDANTITYSLKAVDDNTDFSIDSGTGAVTLTADPDFETKASYNFTVIATDTAGNISEQAISFAINDLIDEIAPVFTSAITASAIDENSGATQVIYTAVATDANTITYSLKAVDDNTDFSIDSGTGAVTLTADPDFETKASYNFTVIASDPTGNSSEQAISFAINDVVLEPIELSALEQDADNSGFVINGVSASDFSGRSVSSAGDVNGDGLADLIVGAYSDDPNGIFSGASFVVFGKADGGVVELSAIEAGSNNSGFVINGISGNDQSGGSVSSAGDVNGDGLADLIVGAFFDDPNGEFSGASFVVFGKVGGTAIELSALEDDADNSGFVINGVSGGDRSGISVSSAGDVNGDGLADLIVGAYSDDPNGSRSGASFVVFGKADGGVVELSAIEAGSNNSGFVINGVSANDRSGYSVSSAGDVNGDGLADLIVGARYDDPNGNASGASFVVFGKTDGSAVELSAIETGTGGFVINGVSANDRSGGSISSAGDVNGDGLADLIVGAYGDDPHSNSASGASFVVFGKTDGSAVELSAIEAETGGFVINGVSAFDRSGGSVSSAGDVNGDGLADLIVGAFRDDPNGNNSSGASFVVFGKTDGSVVELSDIETGTGGFVINGVSDDDQSGVSVSSAGDVNGDGFADLIVGAFRDDPNGSYSGASFVIFGGQGSNATVGTTAADTLTGDANANQLVAGQGDDILIGNGGADVLRGGAGDDILAITDLNFASLDGGTGIDTLRFDATLNADLSTIANSRLQNIEIINLSNNGSQLSLATDDILTMVGDEAANDLRIQGGGTGTLNLVNTGFYNSSNTEVIDAVSYDIYLAASDLTLDDSVRLLVQQSLTVTGARLAPIELSALEQDADSSGFVINGVSAFDQSGRSVSSAGDVNGDGLADLIVGARNGGNSGASFVVFGKTDGSAIELSALEDDADTSGFVINGVSANDLSGRSVSSAGDVNGDGLADLIVGAPYDGPNGGASFVVFGKTDGTAVELSTIESGAGGFVINGVSGGDRSGRSVSSAGDVNGDGLADLIVGAFFDDPNSNTNSGASFVVFGKTDGTAIELSALEDNADTSGFVINGASANDLSGRSVSYAGDVNGDGLADLIVGAYRDDPNDGASGASFVVFGKVGGTAIELSALENNADTSGFVINGVSADDRSGRSVSSAGDVNGDGLADLIVGARYDGPNGSRSGASFVVFGKTDGTAIELSALEDDADNSGFVINGVSANDQSGVSVSSAGDVNGDGLADLIVGASFDGPNGSRSGASFVVFGKTDGTAVELSTIESGAGGFVINGVSANDQSGFSVSSAGDVNGDGLADLIVGAFFDDPNSSDSGASFVIFGGQGSNTTVGTTNADTLTGDATANQLVAGQGDDTLIGNGGADVLRGGAGNDILAISDLNFASLDGGTGIDTLRFDSVLNLDLRALADTKLSSIEVIDLLSDGGNSTLSFDILDLINLNETQVRADTLTIHGTAGDVVNLDNTSNGHAGIWANTSGDLYQFTATDGAIGLVGTVTIDAAVTVNIII